MPKLFPKDIPVYLKLLFKTHESLTIRKTKSKFSLYLFIFSELLKQIQYISAIVLTGASIQNYNSAKFLITISKFSRIDMILISSNRYSLLYTIVSVILLTNLLSKVFLIYFFYRKITRFLPILIIAGKYSTWLINSFILVPMTFYVSGSISKFFGISSGNESLETIQSVDFSLALILAGIFIVLFCLRFFDVLLGNVPCYSTKSISRAHSISNVQELGVLLGLALVRLIFDNEYFLYCCVFFGVINFYSFLYYLPYFSLILNKLLAFNWSAVVFVAVLLLISKKYDNMLIAELNFIVLYIVLVFIVSEVVNKRLKMVQKTRNPFGSEIKLRKQLLYETATENLEGLIFNHFQVVSKVFFDFQLQYIWEAVIINSFLKNKPLALMKIVKINSVKYYKHSNSHSVMNLNFFQYKFQIETDFLLYSVFKKISKKIIKVSEDLKLVKFFNYFKIIKSFDEKTVLELLNLIQNILGNSTITTIEKRIQRIGKLVSKYKTTAKKVSLKFGVDKKFVKIYASFLQDVLNSTEGQDLLTMHGMNYNLDHSLIHESSNFDDSDPLLVISGWSKNLGTIVYANSSIYNLLKINLESRLIGSNFTSLIPEPFNRIHEKVLFKYLFFRNSCELTRSHLFLIDDSNACIEVTMQFRLVFYKGFPYFIAGFKPFNNSAKNMILCFLDGKIVSCSEKVLNIFPSLTSNLFESFENIKDLINSHNVDEIFEYQVNVKTFYMKKNLLSIDGCELMILYFMDDLVNQDSFTSFHMKKVKKVHITEILSEKNPNLKVSMKHNLKKNNIKRLALQESEKGNAFIKKVLKILNILIRLLTLFQILVIITNLSIILNIIKSISVNSIIFDIGLMRYLSCSVLSNTYSLELLQKNYTLAFNETFYKSTLKNNSILLQYLIDNYREITLPFLNEKKTYFSDTYLTLFRPENEKFYAYEGHLINAMESVAKYSSIISDSSFESFKTLNMEKMFILKNVPSFYINTLNQTVMTVMDDLIKSLDLIFIYLSYLELLCLLAPALMVIAGLISFFLVEKSNRKFWNLILKNASKIFIKTKAKLISRLYFFHEQEYLVEEDSRKEVKTFYKMITVRPFLKIFGLSLITLGFYLSITYGPQRMLLDLMKKELVHTNFGGMRRMLTPLTLFWERNALLYLVGHPSYEELVLNYDVPSSFQEIVFRGQQMKDVQDGLMSSLRETATEKYSFSEYLKLMYGDACSLIDTIPNCTTTIAVTGLDSALNFYTEELTVQRNLYKDSGFKPQMFITIEKYSKVIEKAFVFGLFVYANYTDLIVEDLKVEMSYITYLFMFFTIFYYFFFLHKLAEGITKNLEEKEIILQVFCGDEDSELFPRPRNSKLGSRNSLSKGVSFEYERKVSDYSLTI